MSAMTRMQDPASNPAQQLLTQQAISNADLIKSGNLGNKLPPGMVFNLEMPQKQLRDYQTFANTSKGKTFAGGDGAGHGKAASIQDQILRDRFARDTISNKQNQVNQATNRIQGQLGQASGAQIDQSSQVVSALQQLYGSPALNRPSPWGAVLGLAGSLGSAALGQINTGGGVSTGGGMGQTGWIGRGY